MAIDGFVGFRLKRYLAFDSTVAANCDKSLGFLELLKHLIVP
jgi:hypothetical protein